MLQLGETGTIVCNTLTGNARGFYMYCTTLYNSGVWLPSYLHLLGSLRGPPYVSHMGRKLVLVAGLLQSMHLREGAQSQQAGTGQRHNANTWKVSTNKNASSCNMFD